MNRYLLDTNILSELSRPRPDARVEAWLSTLDLLRISAVSVMEIELGIRTCQSPKKAEFLREWYDTLAASGALEVVPFSGPEGAESARLRAQLQAGGRGMEWRDLMIAATASCQELILATHNGRHFMSAGIPIFNPFEYELRTP